MILIGLVLLMLCVAAITAGALNPRLRLLAAAGTGIVVYVGALLVWSVLFSTGIVPIRIFTSGRVDRLDVGQIRVLLLVPPAVPAILVAFSIASWRRSR
jgi:hypothetical protein